MKRQRPPQEKKLLSYAKDGRNTYGESPAGSRKAIPKRKAMAHRALRRAVNIAVVVHGDTEQIDPFVAPTGRKTWKKIPDAPLAEFVGRKLNRRKAMGMNKSAKTSLLLKKGRTVAKKRGLVFKGPLQNESDG